MRRQHGKSSSFSFLLSKILIFSLLTAIVLFGSGLSEIHADEETGNDEGFNAVATIDSNKSFSSGAPNGGYRGITYGKTGIGADGVEVKYRYADGSNAWKEIQVFYPSANKWEFYDDQIPAGYYMLSVTPYYINKSGDRIYGESTIRSNYYARYDSPKLLTADCDPETCCVTITWAGVEGVSDYSVFEYHERTMVRLGTVSGYSFTSAPLEKGTEHTFGINVYDETMPAGYYSQEYAVTYSFTFIITEEGTFEWPKPQIRKNMSFEINEENFPDEVFREYILQNIDLDQDAVLYDDEIEDTRILSLSNMGIKSLKGIEYFTNLYSLTCDGNELEELDLSCNTELSFLQCSNNNIKSLKFGENYSLQELYCYENELTSLDLSGLCHLKILYCYKNKLSELVFSGNTGLAQIKCSYNKLKTLNLEGTPNLVWLDCVYDELEEIIFGEYDYPLFSLDASCNYFSTIDLCRCPYLSELDLLGNCLESLDLSSNTHLYKLNCDDNKLNELDLSKNVVLTELICSNNNISALNLENLIHLDILNCAYNPLPELDISHSLLLSNLNIKGTSITAIDITKHSYLCNMINKKNDDCVVTDNFEPFPITEELFPDDNLREFILYYDYSKDLLLDKSEFSMIPLNRLVVSGAADLTGIEIFTGCKDINISSLGITDFDPSPFINLETLRCYGNKLTELDVSANPNLKQLVCYGNNLSELDLSNNTRLEVLEYSGNAELKEVSLQDCPLLKAAYIWGKKSSEYGSSQYILTINSNKYRVQTGDILFTSPGYVFKLKEKTSDPKEIKEDTPVELKVEYSGDGLTYCWQYSQYSYSGWKTLCYGTTAQISDLFLGNVVFTNIRCIITDKYGNYAVVSFSKIMENNGKRAILDETYFPDENFRKLIQKYDKNGDRFLVEDELDAVTSFYLNSSDNITDLKGIECFRKLESLYMNALKLSSSSLDLSSNTELKSLTCRGCYLETIIFGQNDTLEEIEITGNNFKEIDTGGLSNLKKLNINHTSITSLDLKNNSELVKLDCNGNKLSTLDVRSNTALTDLDCSSNSITSLLLGENTVMTSLNCGENLLESIDISKNTGLTTVKAYGNSLKQIDVSYNQSLKKLNVCDNKLTSLDILHNPVLEYLDCSFNQLISLPLYREEGKNNIFKYLDCSSNKLTALNITGMDMLLTLICYDNKIGYLYVGGSAPQKYLWVTTGVTGPYMDTTYPEEKVYAYGRNIYYYFRICLVYDEEKNLTGIFEHDMRMTVSADVTDRLKIDEDLSNTCIPQNESAVFKISATGTGVNYHWYYKYSENTEWTLIDDESSSNFSVSEAEDASSSELTVSYLETNNSLSVKCVLSDIYGQYRESAEAVLTYEGEQIDNPDPVFPVFGDVNADGTIDAKDVTSLRRYLAGGWNVIINEANSDVNCDNTIDAKDVTMLRRFLAGGWGVTLGEQKTT